MIGPFVQPISESLYLNRTQISTNFGISAFVAALTQPMIGSAIDQVGICSSTVVIILLLSLSCVSMSTTTSSLGFVISMFGLRAFGNGGMMIASQKVVNLWFIKKRGRFAGFASATASLFVIGILPPISQALIRTKDWRYAMQAWAILVLSSLPVILLFFREAPENYGLYPDNNSAGNGRNKGGTFQLSYAFLNEAGDPIAGAGHEMLSQEFHTKSVPQTPTLEKAHNGNRSTTTTTIASTTKVTPPPMDQSSDTHHMGNQ
eukprot:c12749_g2_i6.p1 GENE.c12749_g2_i6~~c12749_g2_i6.p1  ORF type:complete len:261 (+),score=61.49 c12749_g2_i6:240-1022(+)